jgi:tricorn protease
MYRSTGMNDLLKNNRFLIFFLFFLSILPFSMQAQSQPDTSQSLCRYPALHGQTIVFESGGNLWRVSTSGGIATRLTTDPGMDIMPRFSQDGKTIAFTGQFDSNTDVYTIPAEGGPVTRLTYHSDVVRDAPLRWGPDNMVITWTPDGKRIVFLSRRNTFNSWFGRLFTVSVNGGLPEQLPLPKGGVLSYSPDGNRIAYNRIFRNFRTWKDYYGGLAQDIWIYDFRTRQIERVTDWKGTDTYPMWYQNKIYFASDRGAEGRLNIWVYDLDTKTFSQVTHFTNYDVDWPSLGDTGIVFQQGGSLWVIDLPGENLHKVKVTVPNDDIRMRSRWVDASKLIQSYDIAPNGKRAMFGARGDIFTVPVEYGNTRDLTQTSGTREQYPSWSPDGKWVAYTTDKTGESQVAIRPADGSGEETILTNRQEGYFYQPVWAPGNDKLAFSDNQHILWYLDLKQKQLNRVDQSPRNEIHDYSWSPDGLWIAYSKSRDNNLSDIYLYSISGRKANLISSGMNSDSQPVFSPDGKYLYFISARHENPTMSETEFNIATLEMDGVYVTTLQKKEPSPFAPRSDEGVPEVKPEKEGEKTQPWKPGAIAPIQIDLDGLMSRSVPLEIPSADISGLVTVANRIYYLITPPQMIEGTLPRQEPELNVFDLKKRKETTLVKSVDGFALSADGSTIIYQQKKNYFILNAEVPEENNQAGKRQPKKLNLSGMHIQIDPVAEWKEMFNEAWRLERDFFYNTKMNGKDWPAIYTKYEKLLPTLTSRADLNYLIGEMIGELQNSHTYVGGGDFMFADTLQTGLLGVDFALDSASGRYFIQKIYPGDNTRSNYRSPLTEPGIDAKEGDYLLAVDGHQLKAPANPYSLFVNTLKRTVTLQLASDAKGTNTHEVQVKPVDQELNLRLKYWIDQNRERVDKASGGKIGYIYLSDMESLGMDQFIRQFYPQIRKEGLIMDVRYNGGGFIDQIVLERLRRILVGMETNRERVGFPIPGEVLHGYKVALINHYSASDGDIFPFYFKKYNLGPLIGTRTWGGVRGIRGYWTLLDGGYITIPEFSIYGLDSQWVLENHGVEPDIEVDDLPGEVMAGKDAQLDRGIQHIMEQMKQHPMNLPEPPPLLPAYPPEK